MFVLDQTSRPQRNEVLDGFAAMMAGNREADERSRRRFNEDRVLAQADQRRQDQLNQNKELMEFYRQQASPERQAELIRLQEEAEKRRLEAQLEYDRKFRESQYNENPLSRYGLSYGDLIEAEVEDEGNRRAFDAATKAAERAQGLYNELNKGGNYQDKLTKFNELLKKATDPDQKALIQKQIESLGALASAYNESLGSLNRSGFKIIQDGGRLTVAPPPSRMDTYRSVIPKINEIYPRRTAPPMSLGGGVAPGMPQPQRSVPPALRQAAPSLSLDPSEQVPRPTAGPRPVPNVLDEYGGVPGWGGLSGDSFGF